MVFCGTFVLVKTNKNTLILHVAGCIVFMALPILYSPDFMGNRGPLFSIPPFQRDFLAYILLLGTFYLHHYVLLPRFYFRKNYLLYVMLLIFLFMVISIIPEMIFVRRPQMPQGVQPRFSHDIRPGPLFHFSREFFHYFFEFLIVIVLSLLIKTRERWKKAEKDRVEAELSYLKAQMNPHFLFNTLNSIYALALEKSDETPTAVVKLSGMMRYVITEANENFVSLDKEINYISDYIAMQRLRLGQTVKLNYKVNGIAAGKSIAPLVLIPFVENAFKYGVNAEENSDIEINIEISSAGLQMKVSNNKVNTNVDAGKRSGLGIQTTRSRLQLLYAKKHQLNISEHDNKFVVLLHLTLV